MICFHQLKAAFKFFIDPTRYVLQFSRSQSPAIPKASIYGYGILVLKVLDDHIQQRCSSERRSLIVPLSRMR
jgi:hypothetical protein